MVGVVGKRDDLNAALADWSAVPPVDHTSIFPQSEAVRWGYCASPKTFVLIFHHRPVNIMSIWIGLSSNRIGTLLSAQASMTK